MKKGVGSVQYVGDVQGDNASPGRRFSARLLWWVYASWLFAGGAFDVANAGASIGAPCASRGRLEGRQRRQLVGIQAIQPLQGEGMRETQMPVWKRG